MSDLKEFNMSNPLAIQSYSQMKVIKVRDVDGRGTRLFPVNVVNVNGNIIGVANSKEQFMSIWNSDPINITTGKLLGAYGPFNFTAIIYRNKQLQDVKGNSRYELIDSDGDPISDSDHEVILYQ